MSKIVSMFRIIGIDFPVLIKAVPNLFYFILDIIKYNRSSSKQNKFHISWKNIRPIIHEKKMIAGYISYQYFYQDIWAANRIYKRKPDMHYDIGSRVDGFISHLLVFQKITVLDIRPLPLTHVNLEFNQCDATTLAKFEDCSILSLSSLHAIEHFGLGRYGDGIDPDGYIKVLESLKRVLALEGYLYLGVPIGEERLEFNSQRVFNPRTIVSIMEGLVLKSFSYVDDSGQFHQDVDVSDLSNLKHGCGLFEFKKSDY